MILSYLLGVAAFVDLGQQTVEGPWFPVGRTTQGTRYSINVERITGDASSRRAWVRFDHTRPDRRGITRELTYYAFDCVGARMIEISTTRYRGNAVAGSTRTLPDFMIEEQMSPIVPDSAGEHLHHLVCTFPAGAVR